MPLVTYTFLRIVLIVGAGALLYLLGVRNWAVLVVLAVLIGAGFSYVLLDGQKRAAARYLEQRSGGRRTRLERSVERDSEEEDAQLAPGPDQTVHEAEEGADRPGAAADEAPAPGNDEPESPVEPR